MAVTATQLTIATGMGLNGQTKTFVAKDAVILIIPTLPLVETTHQLRQTVSATHQLTQTISGTFNIGTD